MLLRCSMRDEYRLTLLYRPKDKRLKRIGAVLQAHTYMVFEAYAAALFTRLGGWNEVDFQVLVAKARQELMTNKVHIYSFT